MLTYTHILDLSNEDLIKWYRSLRETKNSAFHIGGKRFHIPWYPSHNGELTIYEQAQMNTFTWNWHQARRELVRRGLRRYDKP